jgi:hypothetical protein
MIFEVLDFVSSLGTDWTFEPWLGVVDVSVLVELPQTLKRQKIKILNLKLGCRNIVESKSKIELTTIITLLLNC